MRLLAGQYNDNFSDVGNIFEVSVKGGPGSISSLITWITFSQI